MPFKNTAEQYGGLSKLLHWLMAFLIFGMLLGGFYFDKISYGELQFQLLSLHKSFGLLILYLVGLRIIWMTYSRKPKPLETHKKWEKILSKLTHVFLYIALIGMPVSGWIMSQSGGYPVKFFGLEMPRLIEKSDSMNEVSYQIHEYLAYLLIFAILLHALGALKHHIIDHDQTLRRMMVKPHLLFLIVIVFIMALWLTGLSWLLIF